MCALGCFLEWFIAAFLIERLRRAHWASIICGMRCTFSRWLAMSNFLHLGANQHFLHGVGYPLSSSFTDRVDIHCRFLRR
jgi:hypothetical protein